MEEDSDLIRSALAWATGATIHDVKGLIGHYRAFVECVNRPGEPPEKVEWARKHAFRAAKTLREFMSHGDYDRARRENLSSGRWRV